MATEKRLIPDGKKVALDELLPGTIFAFGDDCIAAKSEYRCANGLIEAFIIDSGEQFWGGAKTAKEQNALMVQPLAIEEVDAVEVVRCKDCRKEGTEECPQVHRDALFKNLYAETKPDDFCSYGERSSDVQRNEN